MTDTLERVYIMVDHCTGGPTKMGNLLAPSGLFHLRKDLVDLGNVLIGQLLKLFTKPIRFQSLLMTRTLTSSSRSSVSRTCPF